MRTTAICVAIWILSEGFASAVTVGNVGEEGFFSKFPGRPWPTIPNDFELIFDVNGTEYQLELPARGRVTADTVTRTGQLRNFRQTEPMIFEGEQDGGQFEITVFPMKRTMTGGPERARLYTRVLRWFDGDFGREVIEEPLLLGDETLEPLTIQDIEPQDGRVWLLKDVTGPRWSTDRVLFDKVVGGEQFTVTLKEFGFTDWGDLQASDIPEPSTLLLLLPIATICFIWRVKRRRSVSSVA